MTRFARAKGSKSSNERIPEQATSWGEMKQQLLEKKQEIEDTKNRNIANKKREENYKSFLEQVEDDKSKEIKWADFGENNTISTKPNKKKNAVETNNNEDKPAKKPKKKQLKVVQDRIKANEEAEAGKFVKLPKNAEPEAQAEESNKKTVQEAPPASQKKGAKRKLPAESPKPSNKKAKKPDAPKPKKDPSLLTDAEKEKIEKRKAKRLKQLELKKIKKAELKKQKEEQEAAGITPTTPNPPKKAPKKKLPPSEKPDRRKQPQNSMIVNGKEIPIAYVDGFPIKKEDAERINQLRKQMISKGLPRSEIKIALKLERRKAEKAFTRERKKVCFNCRKSGHNLSECPELGNMNKEMVETAGTGICFKCGSTEHTHFECKVVRGQQFSFAQCFICKEQGHIARQCPDNARGLYPKGGACKVCGDVTHLKKDCPKFQAQQQMLQDNLHVSTFNGDNPDSLDGETTHLERPTRPNKVIKF